MELLLVDWSEGVWAVRYGTAKKTPMTVTKETLRNNMVENGKVKFLPYLHPIIRGDDFSSTYWPDSGQPGPVEGIDVSLMDIKGNTKGFQYEFPWSKTPEERSEIADQIESWLRELKEELGTYDPLSDKDVV